MSDSNTDLEPTSKADAEQSHKPQTSSSPQQQPSSSKTASPPSTSLSTSREVTFKTSADDSTSRRKREREASLEPAQLTPSRVTEAIPAKKNRIEDSLQEEDDADNDNDDADDQKAETEKIGQIRKKVDKLSTKELETATTSATETAAEQSAVDNKESESNETKVEQAKDTKGNKQSTLAEKAGADVAAQRSAPDPPVRKQPTFSAFSSKSSPFSAVPSSSGSSTPSRGGFSAFAAKRGSGIQPSSLGSSIGSHHSENGATSSAASAATVQSKPIVKGSSFGFGAFAGASPLAKPKPADSPASSQLESKPESSDVKDTFEQKLLSEDRPDSTASETKAKPLLEASEPDTKTGEEDEESIHSIRAKLYTMAQDKSWKERGTGTLRVNVPKKSSDKHPARLVMRADGVLRVILNVALFKGMKCEQQEKFVRIVAFDDGKPVHYAIKMSNPNNAAALLEVLDLFVAQEDGLGAGVASGCN